MFHAWQFDMRGNCVYVAREKEGYQERFSKDDAGLRRIRCSVNYGGFVWVNMNDQPVSMLEEWAGPAFGHVEQQLNSVPLEVVHYHKEYVEHGYMTEALEFLGAAKHGSLFDFGHCAITANDDTGSQNVSAEFPKPDSEGTSKIHLFPGYVFDITGPVLHVKVVTPVDQNLIMIEHRCLLYTSPSPRDRTRSRMPSSA